MRILHTSDWHVGRTLHGLDLTEAHELFFQSLEQDLRDHPTDALLISGDLFDRSVPATVSLQLVETWLSKFCQLTKVILSPGNHDSLTRLGFLSDLIQNPNLIIKAHKDSFAKPTILQDDSQQSLLVYTLPYLEPDLWRHELPNQAAPGEPLPRTHSAVISAALQMIREDLEQRRQNEPDIPAIVMMHLFVTAAQGTDSERDISVGGISDVPLQILKTLGGQQEVDNLYFALGHLHRPQTIGQDELVRYCGSPIPFSFSEAGYRKQVPIVNYAQGSFSISQLEIPQVAPLKRYRGELAEILAQVKQDSEAQRAYAEVIFTDASRPPQAREQILALLPGALVIRHESTLLAQAEAPLADQSGPDLPEIVKTFCENYGGFTPDSTQQQLITEIYEEARKELGTCD
ncbi:hypothetical protein BSR29_06540 [Boudabousia liubingyangii]|uniref:Nuclease SbcCD subunit D n=1 Tax=Boudabousia liubingyangii TaxID=1921764 RepID=A0A1Q5PKY6_9ACTO|nr:exonuclease SbcCD subunit D [Boudabousia liubingyangii]OKL46407.1 hypothetical protein BSR28_07740 [Boudabousia liubingyangii]OKL47271.1 hypothetical protein BSR29_06540 [Boudabousia liubingyangii]